MIGIMVGTARKFNTFLKTAFNDPENSHFVARWDICSACLLLVVAILTPFETGFLDCAARWTFRWSLNWFTNIFFFSDMMLQFVLPYAKKTRYGYKYIKSRRSIIKHYVSTWFLVDLLSIIPFSVIEPCDPDGSSGVQLNAIRAIRLMRLLKLLRLLRGIRIFKRWQAEFGYSERKTKLSKLFCMVVVASHWIACTLGLISRLQGNECSIGPALRQPGCVDTWLTHALADAAKWAHDVQEVTPSRAYFVAMHASMSILVHPHSYALVSDVERIFFTVMMLLGGFIWTQVISRSTAICTSLDQHNIAYQQNLDDVNVISGDLGLPHEMRKRLRKYFLRTKDRHKHDTWQGIIRKMSPKLRRECCHEVNKSWVLAVRFISECRHIMGDVAERLEVKTFSEKEHFGLPYSMYVLVEGSAMLVKTSRYILQGGVWGEDHLLLDNVELLSDNTAFSMSFVQCQELQQASFKEIVSRYPEYEDYLRKTKVRYAFIRGILWYAHQEQLMKDHHNTLRGTLDSADDHVLMSYRSLKAQQTAMMAKSQQTAMMAKSLAKDSDSLAKTRKSGGELKLESPSTDQMLRTLCKEVSRISEQQQRLTQLVEHIAEVTGFPACDEGPRNRPRPGPGFSLAQKSLRERHVGEMHAI